MIINTTKQIIKFVEKEAVTPVNRTKMLNIIFKKITTQKKKILPSITQKPSEARQIEPIKQSQLF